MTAVDQPMERVVGCCPMGCGRTLFLGQGGYITCSYIHCPRPSAVSDLLEEDAAEHVVVLRAEDFTVKHPLRERLDDQLLTCRLHVEISELDGPPRQPGSYRVQTRHGGRWAWTRVSD